MQEGILNEPVRESAQKLVETFSDQMRVPFTNLLFVAIAEDGTFRTANYAGTPNTSAGGVILTRDAVKLIAKHLDTWADQFES